MFSKMGVVLFVGGAGANGFGSMADNQRIQSIHNGFRICKT